MKGEYPAKLIAFENERLEYKLMVTKDVLRKEAVALANTRGGKIMIGVADDGTIVGVEGTTADDISQIIRDGCVPPLAAQVYREDHSGKEVITVTVKADQDIPYMTKGGTYCIRVGATVRIASLPELIDLIVKGPHGGTILLKTRMLRLQTKISATMLANTGFDQALTSIAELAELTVQTTDESTKIEVVVMLDRLLKTPCRDNGVIRRMLSLLATMALGSLVQNPGAQPPSQELVGRVIEVMKQALCRITLVPKVDDLTKHALTTLYWIGLGCIWANYTNQLSKVLGILDLHRGRDRKLTKLCNGTVDRLMRCASEEPAYPPRRMAMLIEPF